MVQVEHLNIEKRAKGSTEDSLVSIWVWILAGPEPGGMAQERVRLIHLVATHMVDIWDCV